MIVSIFGGLIALGMISVVAVIGWIVVTATTGPNINELKARELGRSSEVFASNGTSLGYIQAKVVRQPVSADLIPDSMRDATVAVEDRRFYQHKGVDFEGVVRAAARNLTSGKTVEGGSTLTMQLVRTLYAGKEKSITRKIREAKLAEEYENKHHGPEGKRYILNQYLNNVPYGTAGGQEIIGVQAAARAYYGKPARQLTLAQSAMIAGLPQAPTSYNPLINPKAALVRRNDVLKRMADQGMISQPQAAESTSQPLGVKSSGYYSNKREGYVFDYVKKQLEAEYSKDVIARGGLKVYTSIDLKLQQAARKAMADTLAFPNAPKSAIVTIDPATGHVVAMASSTSYADQQFNLAAQIKRRPGSTFKTMALMAAVRRGVRPESTSYVSKPLNIATSPWGPITVKTYGGTYGGSMNLVRGTLTSDNTVYMQLALDIGPDLVKKAAVDMGIKSKLHGYPAEALGGLTDGVTPLEMANAYATIASGGYRNTPTVVTRVKFPNQKTSKPFGKRKRAKTFINGVTGEVTKILEQNIKGGTGTRAQIQCPAAGKTGTTDDFIDAWFVGFTPKLATSVWVGYQPEVVQMTSQFQGGSVAGGTFPAMIWGAYMKQAVAGKDCGSFKPVTEPITAKAFVGRYASSGGSGTGDTPASTTPATGTPKVDEAVPKSTKKPTTATPTDATKPAAATPAPNTPAPNGPAGGVTP